MLNQLRPETYRLEVSAPGLKSLRREGIVLKINQKAQIEAARQVGDVAQSIDVQGDVNLLQPESTSVGTTVDNNPIVNLPLNTRNVYSLVFLTPGVSGSVGYTYGGTSYR